MVARTELAPFLLDRYAVWVPEAVREEILAPDRRYPRREYGYQGLFRYLAVHMQVPPAPGPEPIPRFGPGEAAAIALARAHGKGLLINEARAAEYARSIGVRVLTVPGFVVTLAIAGTLSPSAASEKLRLIEPNTAASLVARARSQVEQIAAEKGP